MNTTTKAQRINKRRDEIWEKAKSLTNPPKARRQAYPFLDKCHSEREREILAQIETIMRAENLKAWKARLSPQARKGISDTGEQKNH